VVTVFGSAARGEPGARDLDIGVVTGREEGLDLVALVNELVDVMSIDVVDVAHLDRAGPVLRERALVGCIPLYESSDGQYATAQVAAMAERIETDPGRRQDLELLSR
jgi:predicted nucleotidyltransferase